MPGGGKGGSAGVYPSSTASAPACLIAALTREGCEPLVKEIYKHVKAQQAAEQPFVEVDPRFLNAPDTAAAPNDAAP